MGGVAGTEREIGRVTSVGIDGGDRVVGIDEFHTTGLDADGDVAKGQSVTDNVGLADVVDSIERHGEFSLCG